VKTAFSNSTLKKKCKGTERQAKDIWEKRRMGGSEVKKACSWEKKARWERRTDLQTFFKDQKFCVKKKTVQRKRVQTGFILWGAVDNQKEKGTSGK